MAEISQQIQFWIRAELRPVAGIAFWSKPLLSCSRFILRISVLFFPGSGLVLSSHPM
ncbi:hypothetical protein M407DRAFT_240840 [Tulasnella calospora MUT 4182]|uniref:Uncharacterized protein n=1 Tax=Tulasnella calospora MUT 4182 TaxID=1051891 RepID=A0A0C3QW52_9AGAM|nr:hypothetical protein M407DRAFT_240840 [Tulasnella calospora MUT 4182]